MCNDSGNIFQIQRWSVHDGDGIRSTVFLKGCPLRCQWCANPESWNTAPEIVFFQEKCTDCKRCIHACDTGAIAAKAAANTATVRKCVGCGRCSKVCPAGARKKIGTNMTVDDVMTVIKRDNIFYQESGGGVTFSGGEPLAQSAFLRQLVLACVRLGINTAVETSGYVDWDQVQDIFAHLDLVFVDIKHMDDQVHKRLIGVSNRKILENIVRISELQPTVVRVPLIEEINADAHNIRTMCEFLSLRTCVKGVELLPYHNFGESKFRAVGAECHSFSTPTEARIEEVKKIIAEYSIPIFDFK